jgi:hypothetical protein
MIDLYNYSLLTIFFAGVALIVASIEIRRVMGVRVGKQGGDNVSTLEAAVLGPAGANARLYLRDGSVAL